MLQSATRHCKQGLSINLLLPIADSTGHIKTEFISDGEISIHAPRLKSRVHVNASLCSKYKYLSVIMVQNRVLHYSQKAQHIWKTNCFF